MKTLLTGQEALMEAALRAGCRAVFDHAGPSDLRLPASFSERIREMEGIYLPVEKQSWGLELARHAASEGYRVLLRSPVPYRPAACLCATSTEAARFPCVIAHLPVRGGVPEPESLSGFPGMAASIDPLIALAPGSVQELADLTLLAFELAEKYQAAVVLAADPVLASRRSPVRFRAADAEAAGDGTPAFPAERKRPGGERLRFEENDASWRECCADDAEILVVASGTAVQSATAAVRMARKQGLRVAFYRPITLRPFPGARLKEIARRVASILVVERGGGNLLSDVRAAVREDVSVFHISCAEDTDPAARDVLAVLARTRWACAS